MYAVSLTVPDDDGAPATVSQSLAVALPNVPPSAAFGVSCNGRACTLTDESVDPDGVVVGRSWDLGDGATSSAGTVAHVYAADGEYTVRLEATDADGAADTTSSAVQVANAAPSASLTVSCSGLACQFGDSSTDPEGPVDERAWDFGDGATSQAANPSHTYAAADAYLVGLTVTDGDGVQDADARTINVAPAPVFTLSARGYRVRRKHRVDLTWSGAVTTSVHMYRNGAKKATWANDGRQTDKMDRRGSATYDYRLCEVGTQVCSNTVRVVF
jgi:PKD repeat protein